MTEKEYTELVTFQGDYGLEMTMSKEFYRKNVKVKKVGKFHIISIETDKWDEII